MYKFLLLFAAIALYVPQLVCADTADPYPCHRVNGEITVDGRLDEPAWQKAPKVELMIPVTNETPFGKTEGRIVWDDKYIYVGFKAYDKDIWSYYKTRDELVCFEDCLEFFFTTKPGSEPYFNFEINVLGTLYDAYNIKRDAGGGDAKHHRWSNWNCKGVKTAIQMSGTLNKHEDQDKYWQLELAVPLAELPTLNGGTPKMGDTWAFHVARYDYSIYLAEGFELSSSARLSALQFHALEEWPQLRFVQ